MFSIGYYPGCSLGGSAKEYDISLKAIAPKLELELKEIPDWVCCGATSAHAMDHEAALGLAAGTLAKAKVAGLNQVLAPCAMCYQRLAGASMELKNKPDLSAKISKSLGYGAGMESIEALSLMNYLTGLKDEQISKPVNKPLKGLKVACYYGCLLVRPPKITGASLKEVECPRSMERVVNLLGAEAVKWSMATECCGGSFSLSRKETVIRQGRRIYTAAKNAGADLIVLACPMCHSNLDMRQPEYKTGDDLPVLYLTQLMGLAYGVPANDLGCKSHFVPVEPVMSKVATV